MRGLMAQAGELGEDHPQRAGNQQLKPGIVQEDQFSPGAAARRHQAREE